MIYRLLKAPDGWPEQHEFRVTWPGHDRTYGVGDLFEREFTPEQEAANLASGLLERVDG